MSSAPLPSWFQMRTGSGCPLCAPRAEVTADFWRVCSLSRSSVYLWRNEVYRGSCTLVYDPAHATRASELEEASWQQLCLDIRRVEGALMQLLKPDHINVALMGNEVPHLHAWIIPRSASDPRWGAPIWTTTRGEMPKVPMTDAACQGLAQALARSIAAQAPGSPVS